jgi:hypothetical protein
MPPDEFYCVQCEKEVALSLSTREREHWGHACPGRGAKNLAPRPEGMRRSP